MTAVPFDTLKLAERLQKGGFTSEQAKAAAFAIADALGGAELVTKQDLKVEIATLRNEIELVKRDLKIWFGGVGILLAAIRYLPHG